MAKLLAVPIKKPGFGIGTVVKLRGWGMFWGLFDFLFRRNVLITVSPHTRVVIGGVKPVAPKLSQMPPMTAFMTEVVFSAQMFSRVRMSVEVEPGTVGAVETRGRCFWTMRPGNGNKHGCIQ